MSVRVGDRDFPLGVGAVLGVVAWVLGYLFTHVIAADDLRDSPVRRVVEFFGGDLPTWKMVGWVFYNAHFVDLVVEGPFGGATSFVGGDNGFTPLLYVVPPLLLLGAGLAVARVQGATETGDGVVAGLAVVVGYFVLSVGGVFLFSVSGGDAQPDVVTGVLLAGVVYPAVFGAVGAAVGAATATGTGTGADTGTGAK